MSQHAPVIRTHSLHLAAQSVDALAVAVQALHAGDNVAGGARLLRDGPFLSAAIRAARRTCSPMEVVQDAVLQGGLSRRGVPTDVAVAEDHGSSSGSTSGAVSAQRPDGGPSDRSARGARQGSCKQRSAETARNPDALPRPRCSPALARTGQRRCSRPPRGSADGLRTPRRTGVRTPSTFREEGPRHSFPPSTRVVACRRIRRPPCCATSRISMMCSRANSKFFGST